MGQQSLYDRLGGSAAVTAVIDAFVARCAADGRINP
jgi:truncated hemoglobin YjbI